MEQKVDVIIVGTGVAGLFCALNIPRDKKIMMITKAAADDCDSFLAQGGICVLKGEEDYDSFFQDTMKAGHYKNNEASVDVMIRTSPEIIQDLIDFGVEFERDNKGLAYTKEGAHSVARILYHEDLTGKEITSKLFSQVKERENIEILDYTTMVDLICDQNTCLGVVVSSKAGEIRLFGANYVVLATGGLGGLYEQSTNYAHLTGDAIAVAIKHNILLENINYVQFHPTALYSTSPGRRFLISESVRGEGGVLYNAKMERFVNELLPRDLLTREIYKQMEIEASKYVWLSMKEMDGDFIKRRFPNIYRYCLSQGYDVTKECIPVTPAQHYLMGGIKVDLDSKTSMEHLYAVGETSCNGVHGANRLASNSLLESLIFAKRAARHIEQNYETVNKKFPKVDKKDYVNLERLQIIYKKLIMDEMERSRYIERSSNDEA
jgi:L-aspartate oxidase